MGFVKEKILSDSGIHNKFFQHFDNFYDFLCKLGPYVLTRQKFDLIQNVQYLSFDLTPSLPTFRKIDTTYKNGTQKPKSISVCVKKWQNSVHVIVE